LQSMGWNTQVCVPRSHVPAEEHASGGVWQSGSALQPTGGASGRASIWTDESSSGVPPSLTDPTTWQN
jgi:hypothetical protein